MSFFVDIVSEDSFYENLALGATKILEANPCIKNVQLERRNSCDRTALSTWEQKHCCLLTEDLRNFYTSTDGFLVTWSLEIAGEEFPIGRMEIKELSSLRRYTGIPSGASTCKDSQTDSGDAGGGSSSSSGRLAIAATTSSTTGADCPEKKSKNHVEPSFSGSRCKLYELAECAKCLVLLAYQLQPDQDEPSVWLYDADATSWHKLADNFSQYFRMTLVHLGLPQWQICAAGLQLPTWLEQVYLLVGPHLLPLVQQTPANRPSPTTTLSWSDGPTNLIDPAIFRGSKEMMMHRSSGIKAKTANPAASAARKKAQNSH